MREQEERGQRAIKSREETGSECVNSMTFRLKSFQSTITTVFQQAKFGLAERVPTCQLRGLYSGSINLASLLSPLGLRKARCNL